MPLSVGSTPTTTSFNRDLLTGSIPATSQFRVSGYCDVVGTGQQDLWEPGGAYVTPPVGGVQMRIASTSASDEAAGTGARTIKLSYLDANYIQISETITLNGTTPVNTVATNILRIRDMSVKTAGSGDASAGTISLTSTNGSITYSRMASDVNRARHSFFTVPAGKRAFVVAWRTGAAVDTGVSPAHDFGWMRFTLRATCDWEFIRTDRIFQSKLQAMIRDGTSGTILGVPIVLPEKTDIKIVVSASHTGCIATGGFEGWIEDA